MDSETVIPVSVEHRVNTWSPIDVTELGIVMLVRASHWKNA